METHQTFFKLKWVPSERKRSRDLKFEVEVEELEVACSAKCMELNESSDFKIN